MKKYEIESTRRNATLDSSLINEDGARSLCDALFSVLSSMKMERVRCVMRCSACGAERVVVRLRFRHNNVRWVGSSLVTIKSEVR